MSEDRRHPADLGKELAGRLPCIQCGYDLRGLSVLSVCPECGLAIRATVLAVVDPLARELRPIRFPRLTALGVMLWCTASMLAALACWAMRADLARRGVVGGVWAAWPHVPACLVWTAGLSAAVLIRPHAGIPRRDVVLATVGVLLFAPIGWVLLQTERMATLAGGGGLGQLWMPEPDRTHMRLILVGLIVAAVVCLRPNARLLVARSLAVRSGRVDRQTMLAVGASALTVALGDGFGWLAHSRTGDPGALVMAGMVLMSLGWVFVTLGLAGACVDCFRIGQAILRPSPSLARILGEEPDQEPRP